MHGLNFNKLSANGLPQLSCIILLWFPFFFHKCGGIMKKYHIFVTFVLLFCKCKYYQGRRMSGHSTDSHSRFAWIISDHQIKAEIWACLVPECSWLKLPGKVSAKTICASNWTSGLEGIVCTARYQQRWPAFLPSWEISLWLLLFWLLPPSLSVKGGLKGDHQWALLSPNNMPCCCICHRVLDWANDKSHKLNGGDALMWQTAISRWQLYYIRDCLLMYVYIQYARTCCMGFNTV